MKEAFIRRITYHLPEKVLTNDELAALYPEWTAQKILDKTGITERRIAAEDETSFDMAERAVGKLLAEGSLAREDVDFLILMTETPDYLLPSSACVLHGKLGLPEACGAFDVNLGCSAYVYGLELARGLIATGTARNVVLATADTYSKLINPMDKSTRTLFGDGASATWVSDSGDIRIAASDLGTRGSGYASLIVPAGMFRTPSDESTAVVVEDENGYSRSKDDIYMNGQDIMSFSIDVVPRSVAALLEGEELSMEDVDRFFFHQANAFMLGYLRKKMRIDPDRYEMSFSDIGNTVSSSIPIAMRRCMDRGVFPERGNVVLCGFGVGLSWGSTLLKVGEVR